MTHEGLTEAIAALYEAAALPNEWPTALGAVAGAAGAAMGQLLVWDTVADRQALSMTWGIDPAEETRYAQYYGKRDPHMPLVANSPNGRVVANHENLDSDFIRSSEFYQDFLIPAGSGYLAGMRLTKLADRLIFLGLHRNLRQGPFLLPEQAVLTRLAPHLVRAAALHERLEPLRRQATVASRALDALAQGAVLVDGSGQVILLNRAAEEVLRARDGLTVRQGRLVGCDPGIAEALARALSRATLPSERQRAVSAFPLGRAASTRGLLVLVMPLPERVALASTSQEPVALVLIEDPARKRRLAPDLLRQLFGLTPAEAMLAVELLLGKRPEEIAAERGVQMPTVRTQLQAVLAKTGCRRQTDLVRLLGSLMTVRQEA